MKIEKKVTKWKAPPKNNVRVLGMPNIPHPLQGCLEGEAEVLTPSGWQRIDSVSPGDTVMCWSNGLLFFDEVQDTIISYTPEAYKIGFIKQRNFDMLYSPNHRIPLGESLYSWGRDGRYKYDIPKEALRVVTAEKYCPNTARYFFTAGRGTGVTGHLTADERILIAIQADGYLRRENKKDRDFVYDLRFNKSRKIARIRALLKDSTFRWRECSDFDGGKLYRVWVDKESKTFSNVFPWAMSYTKAREFIQELWEWDGYVGQSYFGGQRAMYNSCRFDNISFVQAIAAQAGYTTNTVVRKPKDTQSKNWSVWFIDKKTRRCGHTIKTKIPYNSDMYCITVPSSFFLVRYHNVVMITGNSGCQPRTIAGVKVWNQMRKKCYEDAGYKCEACGYEHQVPADLHAHELFDIDYENGTSTFIRLVCLCKRCVDEDTEVLTADGWKKIPLVTTADRVACWDKDGSIKFEHPLTTVVSHKEKAVKITRGNSTLYFSEDHRLPLKVASKQSPTHGEIHDVLAGDYHASHYYNWLTSGNTVGNGHLTPEERVFIAIEADGCLTWDKENVGTRASENGERQRAYNSRYNSEQYRYTYTIRLVKTRKIERLKQLLAESSLQYEITKEVSDNYCDFNIWTNVECKHFKNCFSQEMPAEKALEFIEELIFWDGTYAQATTSWYTNRPDEVAFVQGVAAQCDIRTQVSVVNRIGNLRKGQWKTPYERLTYAVSFRSINTEICAREMKEEKIDWGKDMYCITTPTSYFIARRDNLVFVTGNCHIYFIHSGRALTMYKHGDPLYSKEKLLEGAEHGFKQISEYNKTHKRKIYVFSAIAAYMEEPELKAPMKELIDRYHIEFYRPTKKQAAWADWKLIWNGKEYKTPYADSKEWEEKMEEMNKKSKKTDMVDRMKGGVFDELDNLLKEGEQNG